jgi:hypothetical protein
MQITKIYQNNKKLNAEKGRYGFYPDTVEKTGEIKEDLKSRIENSTNQMNTEKTRLVKEISILTNQLAALGVPEGLINKLGGLINDVAVNSEKRGSLIVEIQSYNEQVSQNNTMQNKTLKRKIGFINEDLN